MNSVLIVSDLDRTLIYSHRFFDTEPQPDQCVEIYQDRPLSYMTPTARQTLSRLAYEQIVVPATTRTIAQYQRIDLPAAPYRYAVTSNGGNILVDGQPDQHWSATVRQLIEATSAPLADVLQAQRQRLDDTWVRSERVAENLFGYLVVDESRLPADFVPSWQQWCQPRGWQVSRQGRKIYTVPQTLCKSRAVADIRQRLIETGELHPAAPVLAAGDGALDAGLLGYADIAIRPAHGELHTLGWHAENATITESSGAAASEEILAWFDHHAARYRHPGD